MTTCVKPGNLKLNFINVTSIIKIIENILIKKKLASGDYCLKNHKFVNINSLITSLNKTLKKRIKIKFISQKQPLNYKIYNMGIKNIYTKDNVKEFLLKNLN